MNNKTLIIAEIGINHNGDINLTKQLIDVAKDAECDFVKFQKRTIEDVYTKEELDSYRESPWGTTFRQQKEGLEFNLEQYKEIGKYCAEKRIQWFVSPWDLKSIHFLEQNFYNMSYLKIPSAKITDREFLLKCKGTGFPLIMSTGMSDLGILQKAVFLINENLRFLLSCTASYPCPSEDTNLNQIKFLSYYFKTSHCEIGHSDHSGGILFPSVAVALGAKMIEVHITKDRKLYGSDQASSLEPEGLKHLVKYIRELEKGLGEPIKKIMPSEVSIIKKLRKVYDI